jgi:D-lactate dehydrogenase (quinone)
MVEMENQKFVAALKEVVGSRYVLTDPSQTERFSKGFRFGNGPVLAVIRPGSLVEMWRILSLCVNADKIVIMQASNTGLTGGSTPDGSEYDREIVLISTLRLAKVHLIKDGTQVICLPGATLYQLTDVLAPIGREPHSVIGSSCIGASVLGGVCNNSGGALIHRGPAYTQMTLFARVDENGLIQLVNHLGVSLGDDPEEILARVERGGFSPTEILDDATRSCSDHNYQSHVRDIAAQTPARFNADPTRLFESAGSAGKVMLFAVRLDTFPKEAETADFYVGTNDPRELGEIRRHILSNFKSLPIEGEYIHRDAFEVGEKFGKDTFLAIRHLGTARLPKLFALKGRVDSLCSKFSFLPDDLSDRLMQFVAGLFPKHLPDRLYEYHRRFDHHLMLRMGGDGIEEVRNYLSSIYPTSDGEFFECSKDEGEKAFLHRFAYAGAAIRYRTLHRDKIAGLVALDVALPRNTIDWFEKLPDELSEKLVYKYYCAHFFCHVFHQEYIVKKGYDLLEVEHEMWHLLDKRGAEYPAEHNVGHLYHAKTALQSHYRDLDPTNSFNPGIGRTSKLRGWSEGYAGANNCSCGPQHCEASATQGEVLDLEQNSQEKLPS